MWSKPPSTKFTAHPQNEEYCPVAVHNPLTRSVWIINGHSVRSRPANCKRKKMRFSWAKHGRVNCRARHGRKILNGRLHGARVTCQQRHWRETILANIAVEFMMFWESLLWNTPSLPHSATMKHGLRSNLERSSLFAVVCVGLTTWKSRSMTAESNSTVTWIWRTF